MCTSYQIPSYVQFTVIVYQLQINFSVTLDSKLTGLLPCPPFCISWLRVNHATVSNQQRTRLPTYIKDQKPHTGREATDPCIPCMIKHTLSCLPTRHQIFAIILNRLFLRAERGRPGDTRSTGLPVATAPLQTGT